MGFVFYATLPSNSLEVIRHQKMFNQMTEHRASYNQQNSRQSTSSTRTTKPLTLRNRIYLSNLFNSNRI